MAERKKGGQDSKKGKPHAAGKSKGKIADYFASGRLVRKKIRRILYASGTQQAWDYAQRMGQTGFFRELETSGLVQRLEAARMRRCQVRKARQAARQATA